MKVKDGKSIHMVSELHGCHPGSDIYVVGTGTSMRVFPVGFLADKITIGLNMAWKVAPVRYCVTIHPDLNIPEVLGEAPRPEITWVTKYEKSKALLSPAHMERAAAEYYFFDAVGQPNTQVAHEPSDAGRMLDWVRRPSGDNLYQWSSISQTAVNLAANMGARTVILVGCDNCSLLGNHHAHDQHTRWKGVAPDHRYEQYRAGLAEVRAALRERGVDLVTMTPFIDLLDPAADFVRLAEELEEPLLVHNQDLTVKS